MTAPGGAPARSMPAGSMPFAYGVSELTTAPWSFEQDVEQYAGLGVEAIELSEAELDPARFEQQMALLAGSGLVVSSVQASVRTVLPSASQPGPRDPRDRTAALRASIERLALEPLNPVSLNQETAIWTWAQALDVVQDVDRQEVGTCVDLWNLWQDEQLAHGLAAAPERVLLLQVSDWRTPRSGTDRRTVGTGAIPVGRLLHAASDAGYRGPCVVEISSSDVPGSLYDTDLGRLVLDDRSGLEAAWRTG